MMWSSEPHLYGNSPYPGVRKPEPNKHIHYAVTTEWMRKHMLTWAPSIACNVLPCRFALTSHTHPPTWNLREHYGISRSDLLIARCTRVVPQKSIERDLRLAREIQSRLSACGDPRRAFLFICGPTEEHSEEYKRLRSLAQELAISPDVIWGDGLLPFHAPTQYGDTPQTRFSIRDLLAEADLSSFLTTFDYEGFGMPPGEAMAMGVPFIATTYELYDDIYGNKGAIAPLLPINLASTPSDPLPESFVASTMRALMDTGYRSEVVERNRQVVREYFSLGALQQDLLHLFANAG